LARTIHEISIKIEAIIRLHTIDDRFRYNNVYFGLIEVWRNQFC